MDSKSLEGLSSANLKNWGIGYGVVTRSLIIGNSEFSTEDLADLEKQYGYIRDAVVVHTDKQLAEILEDQNFSLVLHLFNGRSDEVQPIDALNLIIQNTGNGPYVVAGKNLSVTDGADLIAAGAADCITEKDERSLGDVIHNAVAADRHRKFGSLQNSVNLNTTKTFDALGDGIVLLDRDLNILESNPAFLKESKYQPKELIGASVFVLDPGEMRHNVAEHVQTRSEWRGELNILRKDGSEYPAWVVMTPLIVEEGNQTADRFLLLISDMTARKEQEQEIRHQANFDSLTQLPNRNLVHDRMAQVLANAKRNKTRVAALFVDLDHFKAVNDTWGHAAGDDVLVEAAARMQACVRKSDTVGRVGGDEFAIILTDLGEGHFAEKVASKITGALERAFIIQGAGIYLSASVGIAIYPLDGTSSAELFENADAAMYEVKRNGRRGYRLFGAGEITSGKSTASVRPDQQIVIPPKQAPLVDALQYFISKRLTLPPIPVFPAGLATACLLILVGWLMATGTLSLNLGTSQDLMTETEMNGFGTASGDEEMDALPELLDLESK